MLKSINLHLAGVSFIHFEAILSGINSMFVETQNFNDDPYEFERFEFINYFNFEKFSINDLSSNVSKKQIEYLRQYISNYDELIIGKTTVDKYKKVLQDIFN